VARPAHPRRASQSLTAAWRSLPVRIRGRPAVPMRAGIPAVVHDLTVLDAHLEDTGLGPLVVVPHEVAEAVVHIGLPRPTGPLEHVGMTADDNVSAGLCQRSGKDPLLHAGTRVGLGPPVQVDHHHVVAATGRPHRTQQAPWPALDSGRDAGCPRPGRPPLARTLPLGACCEEGEVGAPDRHPVRAVGLSRVPADPDDRGWTGARRSHRVRETVDTVVDGVVVREADDIDACPVEDVQRLGRGAEVVVLRLPRPSTRN